MTEEELATIRARVDAATPGPWEAYHASCCPDMGGIDAGTHRVCESVLGRFGHPMEIQDAEFCAAARTDVPALLAEVARLQGLLHGGLRTPTDADPPGTVLGYVAVVKGEHETPLPHRGDDDEWE